MHRLHQLCSVIQYFANNQSIFFSHFLTTLIRVFMKWNILFSKTLKKMELILQTTLGSIIDKKLESIIDNNLRINLSKNIGSIIDKKLESILDNNLRINLGINLSKNLESIIDKKLESIMVKSDIETD